MAFRLGLLPRHRQGTLGHDKLRQRSAVEVVRLAGYAFDEPRQLFRVPSISLTRIRKLPQQSDEHDFALFSEGYAASMQVAIQCVARSRHAESQANQQLRSVNMNEDDDGRFLRVDIER